MVSAPFLDPECGFKLCAIEPESEDPVEWAWQKLGFVADAKQAEVLASDVHRGILNCSWQWGKSTTCAIKAVHYAQFHPESLVVVASPSLRQSGEFLRKAEKAIAQLGYRVGAVTEETSAR
jgi:hypothetical protein